MLVSLIEEVIIDLNTFVMAMGIEERDRSALVIT